jgi:hypothetical protein
MITKEVLLRYVDRQERRGRAVTAAGVARAFAVPEKNAVFHLLRLWMNQLIEAAGRRPAGYKYRLERGEDARGLGFRLSSKGRDRLAWGWRPWAKLVSDDPLI